MDLYKEIDELLDLEMDDIPVQPRKPKVSFQNTKTTKTGEMYLDESLSQENRPPAASKSRKKRREKKGPELDTTINDSVFAKSSSSLPQKSKTLKSKPSRKSVNSWDDEEDDGFNVFVDKPVDRSLDIKEEHEDFDKTQNVRKSKSSRARRRDDRTNVGVDVTGMPEDTQNASRKSRNQTHDSIDGLNGTIDMDESENKRHRRRARKKKEEENGVEGGENTNPLNETISNKRQNRRKKKYGEESTSEVLANGSDQVDDSGLDSTLKRRNRKKKPPRNDKEERDVPAVNKKQEKRHTISRKMYADVEDEDSGNETGLVGTLSEPLTVPKSKYDANSASDDQLDQFNDQRDSKRRSRRAKKLHEHSESVLGSDKRRRSKHRKEEVSMSLDDMDAEDVVDYDVPTKSVSKRHRKAKSEMQMEEVDFEDQVMEELTLKPKGLNKKPNTKVKDDIDDDIDELLSEFGSRKSSFRSKKHYEDDGEVPSASRQRRNGRDEDHQRYNGTDARKHRQHVKQSWQDTEDKSDTDNDYNSDSRKLQSKTKLSAFNDSEDSMDESCTPSSKNHSPKNVSSSRNTTDTDDPYASPASMKRVPRGAGDRPPTGSKRPPKGDGRPPKPQSSAGTPILHRRPSTASNAPSTCTRRSSNASFYVPASLNSSMEGPGVPTGDMTAIFQIDGHSYDVVLSKEKIAWASVSGSSKVPKAQRAYKKRHAGMFNKRRSSSLKDLRASLDDDDANSLYFSDILGAAIKRSKHQKNDEGVGVCEGVGLYLYEKKAPNKLRDFIMVLSHPSEDLCRQWVQRVHNTLKGFGERPKKVKTFIQPYAGRKCARTVHSEQVNRLFLAAGIKEDIIEVIHNEKVKQELVHTELCDYDALVVLGGDGTVSKVVNGLLNRTQYEFENDIRPGFVPNKAVIPVGIIPCGTTNQIVHSAQGIDDVSTAVIHIILGHQQPVDICSAYLEDKFYQWTFNAHYGFFGHSLRYMHDFSLFGSKKIEASIAKALRKTKFIAYECDLQYIPDKTTRQNPKRGVACRKGCTKCSTGTDYDPSQYQTYDNVTSLNQSDSDNGEIRDVSRKSQWMSIKGEYLNVSVLSIPGFAQHAPLGMSKLTHLSDGAVDLAVVRRTDRTEFMRFLKRHGKPMHKNQYDMPFVETFRCKEIRCRIRFKETWNHVDHSYNELNYQVEKSEKTKHKDEVRRSKSERIISDLGDLDSENEEFSEDEREEEMEEKRKEERASKDSSKSQTDSRHEEENDGFYNMGSQRKQRKSGFTITKAGEGTQPRPTLAELEAERRKRKAIKAEEKKKWKAESKMKSLWNLDNEICTELDLHFKVHCGLVTIFGDGVDPAICPEEVKMGCLAMV